MHDQGVIIKELKELMTKRFIFKELMIKLLTRIYNKGLGNK